MPRPRESANRSSKGQRTSSPRSSTPSSSASSVRPPRLCGQAERVQVRWPCSSCPLSEKTTWAGRPLSVPRRRTPSRPGRGMRVWPGMRMDGSLRPSRCAAAVRYDAQVGVAGRCQRGRGCCIIALVDKIRGASTARGSWRRAAGTAGAWTAGSGTASRDGTAGSGFSSPGRRGSGTARIDCAEPLFAQDGRLDCLDRDRRTRLSLLGSSQTASGHQRSASSPASHLTVQASTSTARGRPAERNERRTSGS